MTTLFAMAAVFCASAAVPTYTVNPASDSELAGKDQEIVFTFSEPVKVEYVDFIGGSRFSNPITTRVATGMTTPSKTVKVTAVEAYWGEAIEAEFLLEVYLPAIYNAAGQQIMETGVDPDSGDEYQFPFTAVSYYSTPASAETVEYLGYTPVEGQSTVWNVYSAGWGAVNYMFSGEVSTANASATFVFLLSDGPAVTQIATDYDLVGDWDFWTGNYVVTAYMAPDATITEDNLVGIIVTVEGIQDADGKEFTIDSITYTNPAPQKVKSAGTAGIELQMPEANNFTVFNLKGSLVGENMTRENVESLSPGFYIVNGKKRLVK